jgi:hypothetical protein
MMALVNVARLQAWEIFCHRDSDHLIVSENPLFSFLALFAALFSIKVLSGFFLFCFLLSLPLLMSAAPYIWVLIGCAENNALPIDLCRPKHLHHPINGHSSF